jgi:hypothetical protein
MRMTRFTMVVLGLTAVPSLANASDGAFPSAPTDYIVLGTGVLTLIAAVFLLVISLMLQKASSGSVLADNISWIVAACLCLAASILARWATLFLEAGSLGASQARLGSDLLILTALVLLCAYFGRVLAALKRYTRVLSGHSKAQGSEQDAGGESGRDA